MLAQSEKEKIQIKMDIQREKEEVRQQKEKLEIDQKEGLKLEEKEIFELEQHLATQKIEEEKVSPTKIKIRKIRSPSKIRN
jgi:hypothetical protein